MSKYTTELRFICEHLAGKTDSVGYNDTGDVIEGARTKIFNFSYPIFDSAYKPTLETKILRHYYTREICMETYGLWKLHLEARMNEIMPYYNQLYKSELIEFNPLYDTDITTEGSRDENVDTTGKSVTEASSSFNDTSRDGGSDSRSYNDKENKWDLYSDTPQGGINGIQGAEDDPSLVSNGFLTNARHTISDTDGSTGTTTYGRTNTKNGSNSSNSETNNTGNQVGAIDYTERVYGYRGKSPNKSLKEFRETMLNIDKMVIEELEDLFFQLW